MFFEILAPVTVRHGLLKTMLHFFRFIFHHRRLVGHADGNKMLVGIEAGRISALEFLQEFLLVAAVADVFADVISLVQREDDEIMRAAAFADRLRNGRLGLFMPGLAVDDREVALIAVDHRTRFQTLITSPQVVSTL